jgi:RHS repeat-associated protein
VFIAADSAPYGRVVYTHGPAIDQPLDAIRIGYSTHWPGPVATMLHSNWRGVIDFATFDNGTSNRRIKKTNGTDSTWLGLCVNPDPAAASRGAYFHDAYEGAHAPLAGFGNIISLKRDASGQLYMRNRYYDPNSGTFTQEDPIGLAGGLNLYGFAAGDPVNFSDPFGLCPNPPCFKVMGDELFQKTWGGLAGKSPYLARLVAEASKASAPEFNLIQMQGSLFEKTYLAGENPVSIGGTEFLDASGARINPGQFPGASSRIATINSYVSMFDLSHAFFVELAKAEGKNPNLPNAQVHEFAHGMLGVQGYKSTEAQAQAVTCKVMGEAGGSCRP